MIFTDSNKNSESFGETRTFSVQPHSAEELKKQINHNNERQLNAKNRAKPQPQNVSAEIKPKPQRQPASEMQNPQQVRRNVPQQAKAPQTQPQQIRNKRPENMAVVQKTRNTPQPVERSAARQISMMKTINTDMAPIKKNAVNTSVKDNKSKNEGSGEGGNTVVSVVKAIVYIIFVIVVSVFAALAIIFVGNDVFAFVKSDEVVEITIPEYATLDQVTDILYKNDIIKYPQIFKLYAVVKEDDGEFLAGDYSVSPMMNYDSLLSEFKEKIVYAVVDITIPEGYTTDEIIDLFVDGYGIGTREGFVDVIQNYDFNYWFIDELEENGRLENRVYRLDGYLFPDTYQFYTSSSEVTVINKLLKRFSQIFTKEYRNQCAEFGYSVDEMITLASMIEKEAASPSEFFMVSSVFHNRLNNPWNFPKLESDATVLYILRHESGEKVTITAGDLNYDTPYNTYLYDGLPPGPIANPSASAMLAALSPQTTNYYYFVANKGTTYFSTTKAEHDAYIAQFREETTVQQTVGDVP